MNGLPEQPPSGPSPLVDRTRARLLAVAALCAGLISAIYAVAAHTEPGQRVDNSAFGALDPRRSPRVYEATEGLLETITLASVALLGIAIGALALARRRLDLALAAGVLIVGANVTTQLLKAILPRPDLIGSGFPPGSLPSGHVTVAMSLGMALVLVSPRALRPLAATVGGTYAAGVGIAVLALDWHRPADVLAGYLVSLLWAAVVAAFLRPDPPGSALPGRAARLVTAAAAALLLAFIAVVAAAAADRFDLLRVVDDRAAFVAAAGVTVLAAAAAMTTLARLLRPTGTPDTS